MAGLRTVILWATTLAIGASEMPPLQEAANQRPLPAFVSSDARPFVSNWLHRNPDWRLATDNDCWYWQGDPPDGPRRPCRRDLAWLREVMGNDYQPFYLFKDLNNDRVADLAMFAVSLATDTRGRLLIFNGPLDARHLEAAFELRTGTGPVERWAFAHFALRHGPPQRPPYVLVIGEWEGHATEIRSKGSTYELVW